MGFEGFPVLFGRLDDELGRGAKALFTGGARRGRHPSPAGREYGAWEEVS
jgi:hypothetical protein